MPPTNWIDRLTAPLAPIWTLRRQRARLAADQLRHYEAASTGPRTSNWRRGSGDANAVIGPALQRTREIARDLVRNNPFAESALSSIVDDAVGWGILAKPATKNDHVTTLWREWAETPACDADGRHDLYGLQKLVMRTVVESGECLVRRRIRRPEDGLPIPLQIQVLDPDFLDTSKDTSTIPTGGRRIIQGVEFDAIGRRTSYWLFQEHPGSSSGIYGASVAVPAESVLHIFKVSRPGQVRAPTWFAPTILRLREFDEFEDATLVKQKIAACLAVLTTDVDGTAPALGTADDTRQPPTDQISPGAVLNLAPGRTVTVVDPPQVRDYEAFSRNVLRAIATGIGVTYEDLTGDYTDMPFSAARMSKIRHERRIYDWRWRLLIPQFCDPVWAWAMQAAAIMSLVGPGDPPRAKWTPPPMAMVDPDKEGLAVQRNIRTGVQSWPETARERGYDPDELLDEIADSNRKFDEKGVVLDCDPRKMTQAGQWQTESATKLEAAVDGRTVVARPRPKRSRK